MVALVTCSTALAQSNDPPQSTPVVLTDEQEEYPLGLHLEILEDPSGELSIDDVSSPEFDSQFAPSQAEVPNYGFTDSVYWVRLPVQNEGRLNDRWLLEVGFANMQYVDLYIPLPDGEGFEVRQTGTLRSPETRDILYPDIVFDLAIPAQSQQSFYLRFQNEASMTLPLTLWTPDAFFLESQQKHVWHGLFYGVLFGLLVYNLFLLFTLREASYLFFVILLASVLAEELSYDGYTETYLFPNLYYLKPFLYPLSFSLMIASVVLFSDTFLELRNRFPRLHWVNIAIAACWGVLMLLTPFTSYRNIALLMVPWALVSLVVTWVAGISAWREGFRPARFFMIAWFGLVSCLILIILVRLGIVPSTLFTENLYRLGIVWMAVCWSIALADRINLLKAEAEGASRDLQNSERRLSEILEGLPLGVVVYGKDYKLNFLNRRVIEILGNPAQGIGPDLAAGRTLAQALKHYSFHVAGSGQEYPLEDFPAYRALQGEPAFADDVVADLVDKRVPLEIWASPVKDNTGSIESAVVAFQDITQRKQADAELEQYRKHLEFLVEERTAELSVTNERLSLEVAERRMLEQVMAHRLEWLSKLHEVRQTFSGEADLPQAYEKLSAAILQLLDARAVFLLRWDGHVEQIKAVCHPPRDDSTHALEGIASLFKNDSPLRKEIELGEPINLSADQVAALPASFRECFQESELRSLFLEPMITGPSVVGVLGVAMPQPIQGFSPAQVAVFARMALDLGELARDAQLLDQARALVAAEERNRLARDLHDSVTQVLFTASLVAEVLPQIWRRDPEKALQSLEELRRLTRGALAEMRTMLLELRPSALINIPLAELLTQLTEAVTSRVALPFQLVVEQIPSLPEDVHTSFYRIAQEALNNVVKHAQASQVTVSLSATRLIPESTIGEARYEVTLVIEDDGVGYSHGDGSPEHLGTGIMRERAEAIDATLSLVSQIGRGTQVTLIWHGAYQRNHNE